MAYRSVQLTGTATHHPMAKSSAIRNAQRLARLLDYALGRRPDEFALIPDDEGFVPVKELLKALHEDPQMPAVRQADLTALSVILPDCPVDLRGTRIRARRRDHLPPPAPADHPPAILFTTVRPRAYARVQAAGIRPGTHPWVVLAASEATALRIGRRRGPDPVLLEVDSRLLSREGVSLVRLVPGLFGAVQIPRGCFHGPPLPEPKAEPAPPKPAAPPAPGSVILPLTGFHEEHAKRRRDWKKDRRQDRRRRERSRWEP